MSRMVTPSRSRARAGSTKRSRVKNSARWAGGASRSPGHAGLAAPQPEAELGQPQRPVEDRRGQAPHPHRRAAAGQFGQPAHQVGPGQVGLGDREGAIGRAFEGSGGGLGDGPRRDDRGAAGRDGQGDPGGEQWQGRREHRRTAGCRSGYERDLDGRHRHPGLPGDALLGEAARDVRMTLRQPQLGPAPVHGQEVGAENDGPPATRRHHPLDRRHVPGGEVARRGRLRRIAVVGPGREDRTVLAVEQRFPLLDRQPRRVGALRAADPGDVVAAPPELLDQRLTEKPGGADDKHSAHRRLFPAGRPP